MDECPEISLRPPGFIPLLLERVAIGPDYPHRCKKLRDFETGCEYYDIIFVHSPRRANDTVLGNSMQSLRDELDVVLAESVEITRIRNLSFAAEFEMRCEDIVVFLWGCIADVLPSNLLLLQSLLNTGCCASVGI